jgi:hypothetical protein
LRDDQSQKTFAVNVKRYKRKRSCFLRGGLALI